MTLDEETKRIVLETMGINVFKQLTTVVPDFFDRDYVITKTVEKPKDQQPPTYPHVKHMEPKVVASTHPKYPVDTIIEVDEVLADLIRQGYNVTVSPEEISRRITHSKETLEREPCHSFAIAEISKQDSGFGEPDVFYHNNPYLYEGREISLGILVKGHYFEGLGRCNVHFAFVPKGEKERKVAYFEEGWELNTLG
jgi:hypothetical protein